MKKVFIIVGVLIVLIIGLFLLTGRQAPSINGPFNKVASNLQQPQVLGNDFYYFTGSSFAKIDTTTNKTSLLSQYLYTSGEILVSSFNKDGVVFGTTGTDETDLFGQTLLRAGRPATSSAWWIYDFTNKQLSLINIPGVETCRELVEANSYLYCSSSISGSQNKTSLLAYNLVSKRSTTIYQSDYALTSLTTDGSNVYFLQSSLEGAQTLLKTSSEAKPNSVYVSKSRIDYAISDGQILVDETAIGSDKENRDSGPGGTTPNKQKLILLDKKGSQIVDKKGIKQGAGNINSSSCCIVLAAKSSNSVFATESTKLKEYILEDLTDGNVWKINGLYYYIRGNDLFVNKLVPKTKSGFDFTEIINTTPNKFYISEANNGSNQVYINDSSKDFNGNAMAVNDFLIKSGFDPNQFNFNWDVNLLPPANIYSGQANIIR